MVYNHKNPAPDRCIVFGVQQYYRDFKGKPVYGDMGEPAEEYFLRLRLPSYGMLYDICTDEFRFGQRCLYIGGNRGWRMFARFDKPSPISI